MDIIGSTLKAQGFSDDAIDFIMFQWSPATHRQINGFFQIYQDWCHEKNYDPLNYDIPQIVEYLTGKFKDGLATSTIHSYRSAISTVLEVVHPKLPRIGYNVIIKGLSKGLAELKPVMPKYDSIFDMNIILKKLIDWGPDRSLTINRLRMKLLVLLILGTRYRFDDITKIDFHSVKVYTNKITGICIKPKQTGKGKPAREKVIPFECQTESPVLDIVNCWETYSAVSDSYRLKDEKAIFITLNGKAIGSKTLGVWIRRLYAECGIPQQYRPHSIIAASLVYYSRKGMSQEELRQHRWKSSRTMDQWYTKDIDHMSSTDPSNLNLNQLDLNNDEIVAPHQPETRGELKRQNAFYIMIPKLADDFKRDYRNFN